VGPLAGNDEVSVGAEVAVELGASPVVDVVLDAVRVGRVPVVDVRVGLCSVVVVVRVGVRVRVAVRVGVAGNSGAGVIWVRAGDPAGGGRTRT